ncbi:uncharacterized protein LOC131425114 [Malaya genurostris]|uniref:uncharacterized protein LOC131425114 n=1 Tax=Malaya genurostris TaxID=325434 RepID=UPI0026F3AE34|nr:uncharacterized protein LOC131425114 [Malaya genurostris]
MTNNSEKDGYDHSMWNKNFGRIRKNIVQNGYANGVAHGQETVYQKNFDCGYQQGFSMAFKLSQHHGFADAIQNQKQEILMRNIKSDPNLEQDSSSAHCQLCLKRTLERLPLEEIVTIQNYHNATVIDNLKKRHSLLQ